MTNNRRWWSLTDNRQENVKIWDILLKNKNSVIIYLFTQPPRVLNLFEFILLLYTKEDQLKILWKRKQPLT